MIALEQTFCSVPADELPKMGTRYACAFIGHDLWRQLDPVASQAQPEPLVTMRCQRQPTMQPSLADPHVVPLPLRRSDDLAGRIPEVLATRSDSDVERDH